MKSIEQKRKEAQQRATNRAQISDEAQYASLCANGHARCNEAVRLAVRIVADGKATFTRCIGMGTPITQDMVDALVANRQRAEQQQIKAAQQAKAERKKEKEKHEIAVLNARKKAGLVKLPSAKCEAKKR